MGEEVNPEAMMIALLEKVVNATETMNTKIEDVKGELKTIRKGQEKSNEHLKYEIDLSVARTNKEIADFVKLGMEIDSIHIMPVPSAMSIRLRGLADEAISLEAGEDYTLSNHLITRILVTNAAGSGIAYIHVYGKTVYIHL